MVLDPLTGQEQEPQDLRIVIAHKVQPGSTTGAVVAGSLLCSTLADDAICLAAVFVHSPSFVR